MSMRMRISVSYHNHIQDSTSSIHWDRLNCWFLIASWSTITVNLQKKKLINLRDREASLIGWNTVGVGPTPHKWFPPEPDPTCQRSGLHCPPSLGIPGSATLAHGLHCTAGTPQTLHRRLLQVPHCTLRLSHPSAGGNARGPEIVGQLDMQEPGSGDYCWPTAQGLLGRRHPAPTSATWPGKAGAWSIEIPRPLEGGDGMRRLPQGCGVGAL